jgi:hypothetical protein
MMESGDFGTPMLSKVGKKTNIEHYEFHNREVTELSS